MSTNITNNRLSVTLTEEVIASVITKINEINTLLPFLIGLTPSERISLPKISKSNKLFVDDALNSMKTLPKLLPSYIKPEEIAKDYTLYEQLNSISLYLDELAEKVNDTRTLAGSEAYSASLMAYRMYKAATDSGIPGADVLYQRLHQRFANQGGSKNDAASNITLEDKDIES